MKSRTIQTEILEEESNKDLSTYLVLIFNGNIYLRKSIEINEWYKVQYTLETYTDVYCFNYAFNLYNKKCVVVFTNEEDMERYNRMTKSDYIM